MQNLQIDTSFLELVAVVFGSITLGMNIWAWFDAVIDLKALQMDSPNEARCIVAKNNKRNESIRISQQISLIVIEVAILFTKEPVLSDVRFLVSSLLPVLTFAMQATLMAASLLDRRDRRRLMGIAPSPEKAATGASAESSGSTPATHVPPGDSLG